MISGVEREGVILLLMATNNEERFEIAPEEDAVVGTEILDPNLPSNLDFDQREPALIEMM